MFRQYPRIVAALLLLVFTQKAGLRLWMHDWFHESRTAQTESVAHASHILLKCDCFDDAIMPLLGCPLFTVPSPVRIYATLAVPSQAPFLSADKIYYSLKGPPEAASADLLS